MIPLSRFAQASRVVHSFVSDRQVSPAVAKTHCLICVSDFTMQSVSAGSSEAPARFDHSSTTRRRALGHESHTIAAAYWMESLVIEGFVMGLAVVHRECAQKIFARDGL